MVCTSGICAESSRSKQLTSPGSRTIRFGIKQGCPRRPSELLHKLELKCMSRVYRTAPNEPVYSVVFQEPFKGRTKLQGRRRGRQIACWDETTAKRHFKEIFDDSASGHSILRFGPHFKYALLARHLRVLEPAPMRAIQRAGP